MFHVDVVIHGEEIFLILSHVIDVDEITLGTRNPFDLLECTFFLIWKSRKAVEEAQFKIIPLFIYDILNLSVEFIRLYDDIVFKYHGILETLIETPPVKIHVSKETPDSPQVKVRNVWSFDIRIVMHLDGFLEIIWVHMFFIFSSNLNLPCISTIYDFNRNIISMTFKETFLSFLLIFDR